MAPVRPRLLDELRRVLRVRHYSWRTEATYVARVRRFIRFSGGRHPRALGAHDVERFLSHLAVDGRVAAGTQNQALAALRFLYRDVLRLPFGMPEQAVRAKQRPRAPVVLTRAEVWRVLDAFDARARVPALVATLLYGAGLRLCEALSLRIQDVDLARGELLVRAGKGGKDRRTVLPASAAAEIAAHLDRVRRLHTRDTAAGVGVPLPHALAPASTRARSPTGRGTGRSPRGAPTAHRTGGGCGSRYTRPPSSGRLRPPCAPPRSRSRRAVIRSCIRSPRTCSRTATTSGRCRSCWGTATCVRR